MTKQEKQGFFVAIGIFIVLGMFVLGAFSNEKVQAKPKVITEDEQIESQFSVWDGSHINLVNYLKDSYLNDPESFKHIETTYKVTTDKNGKKYLFVKCEFSANNAFGGRIRNVVFADVSFENGTILRVAGI